MAGMETAAAVTAVRMAAVGSAAVRRALAVIAVPPQDGAEASAEVVAAVASGMG